MKVTIGFLAILFSSLTFGSSVYIAQDDELPVFVSLEEKLNIAGSLTDFSLLGICLDDDGACERKISLKDSFKSNFARMNGLLALPENYTDLDNIPDGEIIFQSLVKARSESEIILDITQTFLGSETTTEKKLIVTPLQVNFMESKPAVSNRKDFSEVDDKLKSFSNGVFKILSAGENDGLGVSSGHGTGFFISPTGYALSNHHVISSNPECLVKKSCKIKVSFRGTKRLDVELRVRILTCSQRNDFCLFKTNSVASVSSFLLNANRIPEKLFTLGFPHDKTIDFEGTEETALTYSFGSPIGFLGTGVTSSMYIEGGASGSPVLNQEAFEVVGLMSNGAMLGPIDQGMPGTFRTMFMLEREFFISKYLNGEIQNEIEAIVRSIRESSDDSFVESQLRKFDSLKSYYGEGKLRVLSYSHENRNIRKVIVKYLSSFRDSAW